ELCDSGDNRWNSTQSVTWDRGAFFFTRHGDLLFHELSRDLAAGQNQGLSNGLPERSVNQQSSSDSTVGNKCVRNGRGVFDEQGSQGEKPETDLVASYPFDLFV